MRYVILTLIAATIIADVFTVSWQHALTYAFGVVAGAVLVSAWRDGQ